MFIFDWPEHTHTSPSKILFNVIVVSPGVAMLSVCGAAFAGADGRVASHVPSVVVVAVTGALSQLAVMVMMLAAFAVPHILAGLSRCITMLLCSTLAAANVLVVTGLVGGIITGGVGPSFLQPAIISRHNRHTSKRCFTVLK